MIGPIKCYNCGRLLLAGDRVIIITPAFGPPDAPVGPVIPLCDRCYALAPKIKGHGCQPIKTS